VSRVSGAHLRGFAPGSTHQGCSGGELLATCGRFDRIEIWTPYIPHQKQTLPLFKYDSFFCQRLWMSFIKCFVAFEANTVGRVSVHKGGCPVRTNGGGFFHMRTF